MQGAQKNPRLALGKCLFEGGDECADVSEAVYIVKSAGIAIVAAFQAVCVVKTKECVAVERVCGNFEHGTWMPCAGAGQDYDVVAFSFVYEF